MTSQLFMHNELKITHIEPIVARIITLARAKMTWKLHVGRVDIWSHCVPLAAWGAGGVYYKVVTNFLFIIMLLLLNFLFDLF